MNIGRNGWMRVVDDHDMLATLHRLARRWRVEQVMRIGVDTQEKLADFFDNGLRIPNFHYGCCGELGRPDNEPLFKMIRPSPSAMQGHYE